MKIAARNCHRCLQQWCALAAFLAGLFVPAMSSRAAAESKPQRIVSLCVQGDQLLLELVPRERIAAVTPLAADPDISANWEKAKGIRTIRGGAEALALLQPDLVLISSYAPPLAASALQERGVRVLRLGIPNDFDELRTLILQTGHEFGEEARAQEIVRTMDERLERIKARRPAEADRPAAMFYFHDGFTPGSRTFANAILEAAGFRNLGARFSAGIGASAPLEAVLMAHPQLLVLTK